MLYIHSCYRFLPACYNRYINVHVLVTACAHSVYCPSQVWWGPAAGGLAAGLASLIDSPSRRRTIMFYILARAIGSLVQILASHHLIPSVPHASGLIYMCIQPLIVLLACHFPKFLPPAYYHSLLKWCQYYTDKKLRVYLRDPAENFIPCSPFMHPGSCHTWAVKDLISGFIMLAKIYSVIYGISGVVYKHKQLFTNPLKWALDTSRNIANSALFFALDAAIIKYTLCLLRNWYKRPPPVPYLYPLICGTVAGFTIFLERPSRQLELVYYCSPQLIYSVWQLIATKKLQHRIPHGSVWLLSLSLMVLSHAAEHNRNTLAPIISNGLHFLLKD